MLLNINDVVFCEFFYRICWSIWYEIEVRKYGLWNELCKDVWRYVERKVICICICVVMRFKIIDNEVGF